MSTPSKNGFLLLFKGDEWYKQLPPEEIRKVINQSQTWIERLSAQGKVKGGAVLAREGATISGNTSRRVIADGPFAESKEAIGGTLLLDVSTLEEAIAIAKTSPSLNYNTTIEVRPLGDECPLDTCARQKEEEEQLVTASV